MRSLTDLKLQETGILKKSPFSNLPMQDVQLETVWDGPKAWCQTGYIELRPKRIIAAA